MISGAKEEAGSSVYPQLIPGTTGTRGDRWEGKKDQKPSGIFVQGGTEAVFVYGPESTLLGEDTKKQPGLGDDISTY